MQNNIIYKTIIPFVFLIMASSAFSQSTQIIHGDTIYYEAILLPDPFKSSKVLPERPGETNIGADSQLKLFPNPAGTYFIVEYEMEESASDAFIRITDIVGREIKKIPVSKHYDQMVVHTNTMEEGIYLVVLEVNGITLQSLKLTISK